MQKERDFNYKIDPLLAKRWSPRSMTAEVMDDAEIFPLFEAARWAPSSYNNQPWRFIYAKRNTSAWEPLFQLMVPFNQSWAKNASLLIVVISKNTYDHNGKEARTHSFDTGAAWMSLALEATSRGYIAHGMEGFDYERARKDLGIPDDHTVEAMVAVGKPAGKEKLPLDLQKKEEPSPRRPLQEIMMEGKFFFVK